MRWSAGVVRSRSEISILLLAWSSGEKRPAGAELAVGVRVSSHSQISHSELQSSNVRLTSYNKWLDIV